MKNGLISGLKDTEKNCRENPTDAYDNGYWDGYYDALDDLLRELPFFEHETTLREFKELCWSQEKCYACPIVDQCRFDSPRVWDIKEMERRMKWQEERRKEKKDD